MIKKKMRYPAMKRHKGNVNACLSEGSQSEKATYSLIPFIRHSGKGETMGIGKKNSGCQGFQRREKSQRIFRAAKLPCVMI